MQAYLTFERNDLVNSATYNQPGGFIFFNILSKSFIPSPTGGFLAFLKSSDEGGTHCTDLTVSPSSLGKQHSLRKFTGSEGRPLSNIWGNFPWSLPVGNILFLLKVRPAKGNYIIIPSPFFMVYRHDLSSLKECNIAFVICCLQYPRTSVHILWSLFIFRFLFGFDYPIDENPGS